MKTGLVGSFALLCACGLMCTVAAPAQTCQVNNSTLNGAYGYVALQTAWTTNMSASTPMTSGETGSDSGSIGGSSGPMADGTSGGGSMSSPSAAGYSNTGVGQLLGGIAAGIPFSTVGRLSFDGAGNVSATSAAQGGTTMVVGKYNVSSDCGITIQLNEAFNMNATPNATPVHLTGIVVGGGSEIDLVLLMPASSGGSGGSGGSEPMVLADSGSGSSAPGTSSAVPPNLVIRLVKLLAPSGCSVSNLSGSYGLLLNGVSMQPPSTTEANTGGTTPIFAPAPMTQPLTVIGRMQFDGGGHIVANPSASMSATGVTQFTGTYTVNSDCTGTMKISAPAPATPEPTESGDSSTPEAPNPPMTVNFVLSAPTIVVNPGNTNLATYPQRAGLEVSTSGSTQAAAGSAKAQ